MSAEWNQPAKVGGLHTLCEARSPQRAQASLFKCRKFRHHPQHAGLAEFDSGCSWPWSMNGPTAMRMPFRYALVKSLVKSHVHVGSSVSAGGVTANGGIPRAASDRTLHRFLRLFGLHQQTVAIASSFADSY